MNTRFSVDYQLAMPIALSEVGGRANNEDAVFPLVGRATPADRLFVVCDGMGGLAKGEEASRIVTESVGNFFQMVYGPSDKQTIGRAVAGAEATLDHYLEQYPSAKGMGTTLALLHLHDRAILATNSPLEAKGEAIRQACEGHTGDNYSAYLLCLEFPTDEL